MALPLVASLEQICRRRSRGTVPGRGHSCFLLVTDMELDAREEWGSRPSDPSVRTSQTLRPGLVPMCQQLSSQQPAVAVPALAPYPSPSLARLSRTGATCQRPVRKGDTTQPPGCCWPLHHPPPICKSNAESPDGPKTRCGPPCPAAGQSRPRAATPKAAESGYDGRWSNGPLAFHAIADQSKTGVGIWHPTHRPGDAAQQQEQQARNVSPQASSEEDDDDADGGLALRTWWAGAGCAAPCYAAGSEACQPVGRGPQPPTGHGARECATLSDSVSHPSGLH